jgi:enoyl-CoA hydratase/carnithine racemase
MTLTTLQLERDGAVARLRLNRPEKRNAQTLEMWGELGRVGVELTSDPTVRVLVLSGNGPSFSAGIDLGVLLGQATGKAELLVDAEEVQRAFSWLREAPFPTVAAVQGHALGAGMQLALACDLRIAAEDVVMGLPEIDFGIFPDLGGCAWLPELVGSARAKELIFTGDRLTADRLLQLGIVNRVVPAAELEATVTALATRLAQKAPLGIRMAKRAIAASHQSFEAALQASAAGVKRCLASDDFREAGLAAVEKRTPRFHGR